MALTATCTLSAGGLLTAGAPTGGAITVGMTFTNASIAEPTSPAVIITSLGTGTGGAGTYNTNLNQAIASSTFTFQQWKNPADSLSSLPKVPQFAIGGTALVLPSTLHMIPPPPLPQTLLGSTQQSSFSS